MTESAIKQTFHEYWHAYGGVRALLRSPYVYGALFLSVALAPAWWSGEWWTPVLQVLPNIVGFSIGGYAIWLGFGDEKFKAMLAARDAEDEISPYMELSATFCHFVVVQLVAITGAVIGYAFNFDATRITQFNTVAQWFGLSWEQVATVLRPTGGFIGFFLFLYAIATALAAVMAIFQLARFFDMYRKIEQQHGEPSPQRTGSPAQGDKGIGVVSPKNYPHSAAFSDVAFALQGALSSLGQYAVTRVIAEGEDWPPLKSEKYLILGANLLGTHWGANISIPADAIIYNLEQWNTGWFTQGYLQLLRQHEVWDYSERNIECLQAAGVQAKLCRIGYHPCLERITPVEQDIDVLFYGSNTIRRGIIVHEMQELGVNVQAVFGVYGPERDALIARSKIVLNLHAYDHSPLEIVRLQLLFANRVCVLTETCSADDPEWNLYRGCMGEGTTAKHLASTAKMLLADDSIRAQLGELGYSAFKARPQAEYLRPLL